VSSPDCEFECERLLRAGQECIATRCKATHGIIIDHDSQDSMESHLTARPQQYRFRCSGAHTVIETDQSLLCIYIFKAKWARGIFGATKPRGLRSRCWSLGSVSPSNRRRMMLLAVNTVDILQEAFASNTNSRFLLPSHHLKYWQTLLGEATG
jgi:hypothetical protein